MLSRHRLAATAIAVLIALSATAGFAATKFKNGTYKGTLAAPRTFITVSMKLKGTKLTAIKTNNLPFYCQGGGPPIPINFASTKISSTGKFKTTGKHVITVGPLKGKVGTKLTMTGQFKKGGTVSGTLKSVYPTAASCSGSSKFSAKR